MLLLNILVSSYAIILIIISLILIFITYKFILRNPDKESESDNSESLKTKKSSKTEFID